MNNITLVFKIKMKAMYFHIIYIMRGYVGTVM